MPSRDYIVNYDIRVNPGNSISEMEKLAKPIAEIDSGLKSLTAAFREFEALTDRFKMISNKLDFKPQIDLLGFKDALASMEINAKETAIRIRNVMERTLVGSRKDFDIAAGVLGTGNFKDAIAGYERELKALTAKRETAEKVFKSLNPNARAETRMKASSEISANDKARGINSYRNIYEDLLRINELNGAIAQNPDKSWYMPDVGKFKDYIALLKHREELLTEANTRAVEQGRVRSRIFDEAMAPMAPKQGFSAILGSSGDDMQKQAEAFSKIIETYKNLPNDMSVDIKVKLSGIESIQAEFETYVNKLQELANKKSVILRTLVDTSPEAIQTPANAPKVEVPPIMNVEKPKVDVKKVQETRQFLDKLFNNPSGVYEGKNIFSFYTEDKDEWDIDYAKEVENKLRDIQQRIGASGTLLRGTDPFGMDDYRMYTKESVLELEKLARAYPNKGLLKPNPAVATPPPPPAPVQQVQPQEKRFLTFIPQLDISGIESEINETFNKLKALMGGRKVDVPLTIVAGKETKESLTESMKAIQGMSKEYGIFVPAKVKFDKQQISEEASKYNPTIKVNAKLVDNDAANKKKAGKNDITVTPRLDMKNIESEVQNAMSELRRLASNLSVQIPIQPIIGKKTGSELTRCIKELQKLANQSTIAVNVSPKPTKNNTKTENKKVIETPVSIDAQSTVQKGSVSVIESVRNIQKTADKNPILLRSALSKTTSGADLRQSIINLQKFADQHPILLRSALSKTSSGADLRQSLRTLQRLGDSNPIRLRSVLSKTNAGIELNQSIARLQRLADSHPIGLRSALSKTDAGVELNQSLSRLQKLADTHPIRIKVAISNNIAVADINDALAKIQQRLNSKYVDIKAKINGFTIDREQLKKLTPNIKGKLVFSNAEIVESLKKFSPNIKAKVQLTWGGMAEKTKQLKDMQSKLPALKVTLNVKEAEAAIDKLVNKIKSVNPVAMATNEVDKATKNRQSNGTLSGRPSTNMKSALYPLLGNTSYGANTPVAFDMFKGMGIMYGVSGAMSLITNSFNEAVQYQNTIETAKSILKDNYRGTTFESDFSGMVKQARDVAVRTKFTAAETADAVRFMAMAGLDMNTIRSSIAPIADIAVIGDNNLGDVADKMTNIQTAFKIQPTEMRKVADMLAKTFTSTNTDMMMLAESMEYAAPMASMANWKKGSTGSLAEALAMIGVMGNSGIQASMAGTTTRMMYQNILKTTKDQRKYWDALGISLSDADGSPRNMIELLTELSQKIDTKSDAGKAALPKLMANLFRVTAGPGAAAVVRDIEKVRALAEANKTIGGNSAEISQAKQNTIQGIWHQVSSTFTEALVKVFEQNDFQTYLREKLGELKNYFASPEFIESLKTIMNTIKGVIETFGYFAKIWIFIFEKAKDYAGYLIVAQAAITQIGYLIKPFAQLVNLFQGFATIKSVQASISSVQNLGNGISTFFGSMFHGQEVIIRAMKMHKIKWKDGLGMMFMNSFKMDYTKFIPTVKLPMQIILKLFNAVKVGIYKLSSVFGLLLNPLALATTAIGAFAVGMYNFTEKIAEADEKFKERSKKNKEVTDSIVASINVIKNPILTSLEGSAVNVEKPKPEQKPVVNYTIDPMLRNTVGFSDIFKASDYVSNSLYNKTMFNQHIAPVSEYLFGRKISHDEFFRMATGGGSTMTNMGTYSLPINPNKAREFSKEMATRAAVIQTAFDSPEFKEANKQLNTILTSAMMSDSPSNAKYDAFVQKARQIRDQFENWESLKGFNDYKGKIENLRMNDILKIREGRKALYKYFDDIINSPQNPLIQEMAFEDIKRNGIPNGDVKANKNFNTLMSAVPVIFKDSLGKDRTVNLKFENGMPVWNAMFEELKKRNIKFENNENNRKLVLFDILSKLEQKLPGMSEVISGLGGVESIAQKILENLPYDPMVRAAAENDSKAWAEEYVKEVTGYQSMKSLVDKANDQPQFKGALTPTWYIDPKRKKKEGNKDYKKIMIFDPTLPLYESEDNIDKALNKVEEKRKKITSSIDNPKVSSPLEGVSNQDEFKNKYARQGARPTQIIINIDKLANFDKTQFLTGDQRMIAETMQNDIAQAVAMAFAQVAPSFNTIAQNDIN